MLGATELPVAVDTARYHGWQGRLRSPWWGSAALVRVAFTQVLRRKAYWLVLGLGFTQFLAFWAVIYAVTQFNLPPDARRGLLDRFGFSAEPGETGESGYIRFMERQSVVVVLLLAFSGSLLVGADFRLNALAFYLSRRMDRRHYIVGKLLAIVALVASITTAPALLLFMEYGMFSSSAEYWISNWRLPLGVLAYGAVMAGVLSIWLVALSAWLQRVAPIAVTWSSLFVLLPVLRQVFLRRRGDTSAWRLIDPWFDIRVVGRLCFGQFRDPADRDIAWWAAGLLAATCAVALAALVYRVRAVDVVE